MQTITTPFSPYIGITDFMSAEQSEATLLKFSELTQGHIPHKLMIGVMMSYKTLRGMDTKWAQAFPENEAVASIFVEHPLAFNTLHYADYTNTDIASSLTDALNFGGRHLHALQLDMVWPSATDVATALGSYKKSVSVILQVGKNAIEEANNDPTEVIARLADYGTIIDGVLYDKSMGQGKSMDSGVLLPFVEATYEKAPKLRVAVAGGLGPTTMHVVEPLITRFPDISIDAQGRLRPSGSALDPIDWSMAEEYLRSAVAMFRAH